MAANQNPKSLFVALGVSVFLVIVISGYATINDLAGKQSQQHQQSISPVFALIENELTEPLHIAKTLAEIGVYDEYFQSQTPDEEKLVPQLKSYQDTFGLQFYLAHENSRKQFNSDGRVFDLIEGEIVWYFALKDETDSEIQAVLGQREDVHLFIDVRQYDDAGNFIGFAGVGKSLSDFLRSFEEFRSEYGHEFVFVNNRQEIVLSSIPELSPAQALHEDDDIGIKLETEMYWYEEFIEKSADALEPSAVVEAEDGDLLISRLNLENLNWSLYILTPLNSRQQEVNQSFAIYVALGMILVLFVYKILYRIIDAYIDRVSCNMNQDPLTGLANRKYGRHFFNRMRKRNRQIAVVVTDLDHFKRINDTYGHMAGDHVLKEVSESFASVLDKKDLAVRWGGEEFAFILPDTDGEEAKDIAEAARLAIERLDIAVDSSTKIKITASFGIYASRQYADTLDVMIERADRAMYKAKADGKNKVLSAC
ncbi:diguanylate cyclase [Agaribacter flavus]|uniref:diguanylate cyclase n=1 Tax=Agaribacter flavus TaxID=1902781 RepID=A0ABV7FSG6_9ALTE